MSSSTAILLILLQFFHLSNQWKSIYDRIMEEPEFSGYKNMIKGNKIITLDLLYSGVTIFVPENSAFYKYDGFFTEELILYHLATEPYSFKDLTLNSTIECVHRENPPLWVTVTENGYFINNAKVSQNKSNYIAKTKRNQSLKQVLHVIDQVLDPMLQTPFSKPTAYDLLENSDIWKLGSRKISNFAKRVQFHNREELYQKQGGHTFFIPINDKRHDHRLQEIDGYIIDAHIVPHMVLFTRATRKNFVFETAANGDYIYIVLKFVERNGRNFVKSVTVLGNTEHQKGELFAEIVRGDIPVSNGVVHLISQPLAVFDRRLKPFPYLSTYYKIASDPELNMTYSVAQNGRITKILKKEKGMYTFFAPRNRAWRQYLNYNSQELSDILSRHLIVSDSRLTISKLATSSHNSGTTMESLGGTLKMKVIFSNDSFYLVWGQKWIRVVRADYECSDGVVHIIDDLFAFPKLASTTTETPKVSFWDTLKHWVT